jgi:uncharacterized membrane protein (DUF373 family)
MDFTNSPLEQSNTFENTIAKYINHFIRALHVLFSIALMITVVLTVIIFGTDIYQIFLNGNLSTGTIHALGSLLVLWTLSELLHSEVRSLMGERMQVSIFIEVAIAAFVRKLLVISTEGVALADASIYLISLLVLGIVYWILHTPNKSNKISSKTPAN